jgi:hypothetical protein
LIEETGKKLPPDLRFSDEKQDTLAKRQANAAVALLGMNQEKKQVWCAILATDGATLAAHNRAGLIHLRDPASGEISRTLKGHGAASDPWLRSTA